MSVEYLLSLVDFGEASIAYVSAQFVRTQIGLTGG